MLTLEEACQQSQQPQPEVIQRKCSSLVSETSCGFRWAMSRHLVATDCTSQTDFAGADIDLCLSGGLGCYQLQSSEQMA